MDYRSNLNAITGIPPSKLLHGREMRMKLHIIRSPDINIDENDLCEKVKMKKRKEYIDKKGMHCKLTSNQVKK